jgi:hypothetical protein
MVAAAAAAEATIIAAAAAEMLLAAAVQEVGTLPGCHQYDQQLPHGMLAAVAAAAAACLAPGHSVAVCMAHRHPHLLLLRQLPFPASCLHGLGRCYCLAVSSQTPPFLQASCHRPHHLRCRVALQTPPRQLPAAVAHHLQDSCLLLQLQLRVVMLLLSLRCLAACLLPRVAR